MIKAVQCLLGWICLGFSALAYPSIVIIDAGHGGHDRGGMPGQRLPEKMFTLDTARRLERALRATGNVRTVMTRRSDDFVSLSGRVAIANRFRNRDALFVSIHYNAGRREGAYGIETYYQGSRSYRFARAIHYRVIRAMNSIDRGIRSRGFYVLRKTRVPSVLVECGFLTNRAEARRASDPDYRQATAEAIARAIMAMD
jgi:N-acetylmuramoyl-L-alanine amidase